MAEAKNDAKVRAWLATAATVPGFIGFAVGRTDFWEPLVGWRAKKSRARPPLTKLHGGIVNSSTFLKKHATIAAEHEDRLVTDRPIEQLAINTIRTLANQGSRRQHALVGGCSKRRIEIIDSVLPPAVKARVSVEEASTFGWERYIGDHGESLGMHFFGASAPLTSLQQKFGFTPEHVVEAAKPQVRGE